MLAAKTEEIKMTVGRLKRLSSDERTRMLFEARRLYLMDEAAVAEGEARGRTEGKNEGKLEIVKQMLLGGFDIDVISQVSGMSEEEIKDLK